MSRASTLPFLLTYEEEPSGDSVIDGLDHDYLHDSDIGGMDVRMTFVPWDSCLTLLSPGM